MPSWAGRQILLSTFAIASTTAIATACVGANCCQAIKPNPGEWLWRIKCEIVKCISGRSAMSCHLNLTRWRTAAESRSGKSEKDWRLCCAQTHNSYVRGIYRFFLPPTPSSVLSSAHQPPPPTPPFLTTTARSQLLVVRSVLAQSAREHPS